MIVNGNNKENLIIFMHIPKTAGTTFHLILDEIYQGKGLKKYHVGPDVNVKVPNRFKFAAGHIYFGGVSPENPNTTLNYITLLRDPLERVISEYYFLRQYPIHNPYVGKKISDGNITLKDYVKSKDEKFKCLTHNMQTRYVVGGDRPDIIKAKNNLNKHFAVVGITELFNDSLDVMKEKLGWGKIPPYKNGFINKKRLKLEEIPRDIIDVIKMNNKIDIELYQWAKKNLEQEIKRLKNNSK